MRNIIFDFDQTLVDTHKVPRERKLTDAGSYDSLVRSFEPLFDTIRDENLTTKTNVLIASTSPRWFVERFLDRSGLRDIPSEDIVCYGDRISEYSNRYIGEYKPNPLILSVAGQRILDKGNNIGPIFSFGDRAIDMIAANRTNFEKDLVARGITKKFWMTGVGCLWGSLEKAALIRYAWFKEGSAKPGLIVSNPDQMIKLLECPWQVQDDINNEFTSGYTTEEYKIWEKYAITSILSEGKVFANLLKKTAAYANFRTNTYDDYRRWCNYGVYTYSLFPYYPKPKTAIPYSKYDEYRFSQQAEDNRNFVYKFKDGYEEFSREAADKIAEPINRHYSADERKSMALFCVPPSSAERYQKRYSRFAEFLSNQTGLENLYESLTYRFDGGAKHLGSGEKADFVIDEAAVKGKNIILFDDIVTTGASLTEIMEYLERLGATVISAFTLGRTCHSDSDKLFF